MGHWHRTAFNLLDAVGKGISAAEIDWRIGPMQGREAVVIAGGLGLVGAFLTVTGFLAPDLLHL